MSHTQDRGQNAPQLTSAAQASRETAPAIKGEAKVEPAPVGPWFPIWNDHYWEINVADDKHAHTVAVVWAHSDGDPSGAEADARLIAAAPDMKAAIVEADGCFEAALAEGWLEALANGDIETIRDLWDRRLSYARDQFPAALAKAEGSP